MTEHDAKYVGPWEPLMDVRAPSGPSASSVPTVIRVVAYFAAAWCLGFAAVSAWLLATGPASGHALEEHGAGLAAMNVLVLLLKLAGAWLAVASVRRHTRLPPALLAAALWGAAGTLLLYSVGSLAIAFATTSGLVAPSAAWQEAGGVTARALLYVAFFLVGACMFTVIAASYHRRTRARWRVALVGLLGAPAMLGVVLVVAPWILTLVGLLPL